MVEKTAWSMADPSISITYAFSFCLSVFLDLWLLYTNFIIILGALIGETLPENQEWLEQIEGWCRRTAKVRGGRTTQWVVSGFGADAEALRSVSLSFKVSNVIGDSLGLISSIPWQNYLHQQAGGEFHQKWWNMISYNVSACFIEMKYKVKIYFEIFHLKEFIISRNVKRFW